MFRTNPFQRLITNAIQYSLTQVVIFETMYYLKSIVNWNSYLIITPLNHPGVYGKGKMNMVLVLLTNLPTT